MNIIQFWHEQEIRFGVLQGESVHLLEGSPFSSYRVGDYLGPLEEFRILAPIIPRKIIGIARNTYSIIKARGFEIPGEPEFFLKPDSSVIGPGDTIDLPKQSQEVICEPELGIVIGKYARNIPVEYALTYVLGYTCANDVTARDIMLKDRLVDRSKSFDTFCPLGPTIYTEALSVGTRITCYVNQTQVADFPLEEYIFQPAQLISYLSQMMTLFPGDVILCGSSSDQRKLEVGDQVTIEVEPIGKLCNRVGAEK